MDTLVEKAIKVHVGNEVLVFNQCEDGLYYLNTNANGDVVLNSPVNNYTATSCNLLQTVAGNKEHFSRREIKGAHRARALQAQIGWPGTPAFKSIIAANLIRNCGITVDDISRAEYIYGPPVPTLKGKMTRVNQMCFQHIGSTHLQRLLQ